MGVKVRRKPRLIPMIAEPVIAIADAEPIIVQKWSNFCKERVAPVLIDVELRSIDIVHSKRRVLTSIALDLNPEANGMLIALQRRCPTIFRSLRNIVMPVIGSDGTIGWAPLVGDMQRCIGAKAGKSGFVTSKCLKK